MQRLGGTTGREKSISLDDILKKFYFNVNNFSGFNFFKSLVTNSSEHSDHPSRLTSFPVILAVKKINANGVSILDVDNSFH